MADGHGGARQGSGRKPRREKFASQIAAGDQIAADNFVRNVETLQLLASMDREIVHEEWAPAGTVMIDDIVTDDEGKTSKVRRLAFPDKPARELVLIKRRVVRRGPSERVAMYLVDRVAGKPVQAIEGDLDIADPNAIVDRFEAAIAKVYGEGDESSEQDGGE